MTDKVPAHSEIGNVRPTRQAPSRASIREDGFNQAGSVKERETEDRNKSFQSTSILPMISTLPLESTWKPLLPTLNPSGNSQKFVIT